MSIEPTPELVTEKLREAIAELRRPISTYTGNGWAQGDFGQNDSCKCLDGALFWAAGGDRRHSLLAAMRRRVADVIADIAGVEPPGWMTASFIWRWNDDGGRVFAEVEAVLERAIDAAEVGV